MRPNGSQFPRPQTMTEIRTKPSHNILSNRNITHRSRQKQTIQYNQQPQFHRYTQRNPEKTQNYICITIPKNISLSDTFQATQRKPNLYSRENIQIMNKKYRQIRTSRINPSVGLYDIQNDKRILPTRTLSAMNDYRDTILTTEMRPEIRSLKKIDKKALKQQIQQKKNNSDLFQDPDLYEQGILKAKNKKRSLQETSKTSKKYSQKKQKRYDDEQKEDECGYLANKFQAKMKKKCMQDNLHVMANLLKRKIKILDKKDLMNYLNKLAKRNTKST